MNEEYEEIPFKVGDLVRVYTEWEALTGFTCGGHLALEKIGRVE